MNLEEKLEEFSRRRKETDSILKYTLFFDTETIKNIPKHLDLDSFSQIITGTANKVWDNCQFLINYGDFNIFGYKNYNCADLSCLMGHSSFWKHALTQDAILSSYFKLRKIIGECNTITDYERVQLSNYTIDLNNEAEYKYFDHCYHGMDYLLSSWNTNGSTPYCELTSGSQKKSINFSKNPDKRISYSESDENPYAAYAPNFKRRVEQVEKQLENVGFNTGILSIYPPHIFKCFLLKIQGFSAFSISVNEPKSWIFHCI